MKALSIALHQLRANWPDFTRTSIASGIGLALGCWLIFFNIPGQPGWSNGIGSAGRCVLLAVWIWIAVSLVMFIGRDRLGDQSQFFSTRPVPRWLRVSSSCLLAMFLCALLAAGPVFFGAWLFNFPPGWSLLMARWIGVGFFLLLIVLALVWSRGGDGWLRTRVLLAGIGVFIGNLVNVELRGWVPRESFRWVERLPVWLPLLVLGIAALVMIGMSLRRASGLPRGVFVVFGAVGALVIPSEIGVAREGVTSERGEFAVWAGRLSGGGIEAQGRRSASRTRESFELMMPEFDAGRYVMDLDFRGMLVDGDGAKIFTLDQVSVGRGGDWVGGWEDWLLSPARFLGLEKSGVDLRVGLRSRHLFGGAIPRVREQVSGGGEYFIEGQLEVTYREVSEIGRGSMEEGLRWKQPGLQVRVEPLSSDADPTNRRVRARLLYGQLSDLPEKPTVATDANRFLVFCDPSAEQERWRAFLARPSDGAGWWPELGSQWVVDQLVTTGLRDGGEFICVMQSPPKRVSLPVRLRVEQLDRVGKLEE